MINKLIAKTILTAGLTVSLTIGYWQLSSKAQEIYIDEKCQQNSQLDVLNKFRIFYQYNLKIRKENYLFYSGRFQDGAVIFCLSKAKFKQARPLNELKLIQFNFIEKVTKDPKNKTSFLIITHEGNGSNVQMNQYRLNFSTPSKPVLIKLRSWRAKT